MRDFLCFVHLVSGLYIFLLIATPAAMDMCDIFTKFSLKHAKCTNLNLKTIPKDLDKDLKVLEFNDNQLTYLGKDEFKNYLRLQEIFLARNRIEMIAQDAFRGLHNIQILDLEGNKLQVIPKDTFQHLTSVRILIFKSNPIRFIAEHTFDMLQNIEELNFENCWLERVDPRAFQGLNRLNEINLVNNELKALSSSMQEHLSDSIQVFRLYRNPWICDCRLTWLIEFVKNKDNEIIWDFKHNIPSCAGPPLLANINWRQLTPKQFACPARIVTSNTTSIVLPIGGNATIECNVFGDPEPSINWMKGDKYARNFATIQKVVVSNSADKQVKSHLTLHNVKLSHAGDYKCIAENFAGRSEVTYKVWVEGLAGALDPEETTEDSGMSKEAYLGIGVAVAVLLLLIVICVIYVLKKREQKKHEYKVRDYKKPNKGAHSKESSTFDEEDQREIKDKSKDTLVTSATETEKRELLEKQDSNGPAPKSPDTAVITQATTELPNETKHLLPKNEPQKEIDIEKNKDEDETPTFHMKIFVPFDDKAKQELSSLDDETDKDNSVETAFIKANGKVASKDTTAPPDILRNGKHGVPNHKAVPVPPPTVPNHLESAHQRAAENPYAKPSELRPATKKSGSADDLLDCKIRGNDHKSKERSREKEVTFKDPPATTTTPRVKIRDPSPKTRDHHKHCNNPVCLKDHTSIPETPQMRNSQSLTGMNTLDGGGLQEIDVDHIVDPVYHRSGLSDRYVDRYRTLPSKSSRHPSSSSSKHFSPPTTAYNSPVRSSPQSYQTLPVRGHSASPTKHLSRNSPTRGSRDRYSGFPAPTHSPYGIASPRGTMSSPEDNITYGPVSGSPTKSRRTFQGTATLDELLSPPFGGLAPGQKGSKTQSAKKVPKPGEKDEFGTAV